jgi:hypothetical protein
MTKRRYAAKAAAHKLLFCSECGAKAEASCDCGVSYVPAGVAAAKAVAAHPEKSDRAIAKITRIPLGSIQRARSTDSFESVGKRIGLDGKARRLPRRHDNPTPEEMVDMPAAAALLVNIRSTINALKTEGKNHETTMSPNRVGSLVYELLTQINECRLSPVFKAKACANLALQWKIDGTKLNNEVIDAVRKAANAWSDLLKRLLATAEEKEKSEVSSPSNRKEPTGGLRHATSLSPQHSLAKIAAADIQRTAIS